MPDCTAVGYIVAGGHCSVYAPGLEAPFGPRAVFLRWDAACGTPNGALLLPHALFCRPQMLCFPVACPYVVAVRDWSYEGTLLALLDTNTGGCHDECEVRPGCAAYSINGGKCTLLTDLAGRICSAHPVTYHYKPSANFAGTCPPRKPSTCHLNCPRGEL